MCAIDLPFVPRLRAMLRAALRLSPQGKAAHEAACPHPSARELEVRVQIAPGNKSAHGMAMGIAVGMAFGAETRGREQLGELGLYI